MAALSSVGYSLSSDCCETIEYESLTCRTGVLDDPSECKRSRESEADMRGS
jgi:hypothetical protein